MASLNPSRIECKSVESFFDRIYQPDQEGEFPLWVEVSVSFPFQYPRGEVDFCELFGLNLRGNLTINMR